MMQIVWLPFRRRELDHPDQESICALKDLDHDLMYLICPEICSFPMVIFLAYVTRFRLQNLSHSKFM